MRKAKYCSPLLLAFYLPLAHAEPLPLDRIEDWAYHSFEGDSTYAWQPGEQCLLMRSDGTASGRVWEQNYALTDNTVLRWRWQQREGISGVNQRSEAGDDFSARIYVVVEHPFLFWRSRVLSYVHAAEEAVDEHWPNPFTGQFHMWVVSNGDENQWQTLERTIAEDWYQAFGDRPERFHAIGLMVDSDNSGQRTAMCLSDLSVEQAAR
ncbi:MAG: DUF3047 domain-containing protein [Saccharospirillum sp.]